MSQNCHTLLSRWHLMGTLIFFETRLRRVISRNAIVRVRSRWEWGGDNEQWTLHAFTQRWFFNVIVHSSVYAQVWFHNPGGPTWMFFLMMFELRGCKKLISVFVYSKARCSEHASRTTAIASFLFEFMDGLEWLFFAWDLDIQSWILCTPKTPLTTPWLLASSKWSACVSGYHQSAMMVLLI